MDRGACVGRSTSAVCKSYIEECQWHRMHEQHNRYIEQKRCHASTNSGDSLSQWYVPSVRRPRSTLPPAEHGHAPRNDKGKQRRAAQHGYQPRVIYGRGPRAFPAVLAA